MLGLLTVAETHTRLMPFRFPQTANADNRQGTGDRESTLAAASGQDARDRR